MKFFRKLFYCISIIMICNVCYCQDLNGYVNSGGLSNESYSYHVGEIFVIDIMEPEDIQEILTASLVPNPVLDNGRFIIEGNLQNNNIEVYNISGQQVRKLEINNNYVDLTGLSSGLYFIKSSSNEFTPIKIIKL